jgi:hypothetical protein
MTESAQLLNSEIDDAATKFDKIEHYQFIQYFQRGGLIDDKWLAT